MAFNYGFYDSINGDRKYSAMQFAEIFNFLIKDGVYKNVENEFKVVPSTGFSVNVKSGRAWFNNTWNTNTTDFPLTLEMSDLLLPRIDMIVLEVDSRVTARENGLKVLTGYPATNPVRPALTKGDSVYQYPLASIAVAANAATITAADITNLVGTAECPWVSPILELISIKDAFAQFEAQFRNWLDSLQGIADETLLTALKFQLDAATNKVTALETKVKSLEAELDAIQAAL